MKHCIVCGKPLNSTHPAKKYCSPECAGVKRAKKVPKPKKPPKKTFDEIVAESDACGMSYGKYKVALQSGKTFEELKTRYETRKKEVDLWQSF